MTTLLNSLNNLRADPTVVIKLYKQLFEATFFSLVRQGTETSLDTAQFLTYNATDNVRELPLFTDEKFVLNNLSSEAIKIKFGGEPLWTRLLNDIETGKCEVAINPGQPHGIRLTKEMVLGIIASYGLQSKENDS